jgi:phospholipase C
MHPPSPINLGEAWTKKIYEAVRGSPQWNNTLFIITFDEHGVCNKITQIQLRFTNLPQGFSDHVPAPVGVPSPDNLTYTETAADGKKYTFNFTRLGVRCVSI